MALTATAHNTHKKIKTMAIPKLVNVLIICITFLIVSAKVSSRHSSSYTSLSIPSVGAHSFAFDSSGRGPYTSVSDGRILFYQKSKNNFTDFAYTSVNRTSAVCDGVKTLEMLRTCGRALSLAFFYRTGQLYIADAALGMFVVGPSGGQATQLATSSDGAPFRFTVGLDVDQVSGDVYFTDASSTGGLDEVLKILSESDASGRLLKYDAKKKTTYTLLNGISGAAGVAISKDRSFLLLTEFIGGRIKKYWLRGPKANTAEVIMNVTGIPDNIRRTSSGNFWVAVTSFKGQLLGLRINESGNVLETLTFSPQFEAQTITEVHEHKDSIYLGSLMGDKLGVYKK